MNTYDLDTTPAPSGLAQQLEFTAEQVRDHLGAFLELVMVEVTTAYRLSGEADLHAQPEADELWMAQATRTFADLTQVESLIGALHTLLTREDPVGDAILEARNGGR